ncbi:gliding motility-associated C-terminal domain-containing protein [Marivirga salinae]|uniref:Gliding motility-associated C-terminal domain-containing protein n=1 Tax=Marivirga salinarum TaxID=3059078 RepID=A0AA51NBV7_9BACT|nr:gliding motility-associated C-terminal domain-containing protein [Marivirga sp. BDSF4-3]WMN10736.1 gliding motility-associated C-terminal domain-containing protein [Marivirga sp. BDSF4-3]
MKYIYTILLGFILSISLVNAQCPNDSNTEATIVSTDALCFAAEDGTISFELKDASDVSLDPVNFDFGLYDGGENDWVYDDIGVSPGGDINPAITLSISGTVLTFSNVPTTKDGIGYTIGSRDNGICGITFRTYSSGFSGIIINEPSELTASINLITDDCDNSNSGAIDIDVTGGTPDGGGNYNYSWSNGATTEDISGLDDGTYSVTVTDDNGCTAELTGIVVEAGPDAGTAGSADACNNDAAFNLYNVLGGTPQLSGSFAAAIGNPEAVTISQPGDGSTSTADFDGVATGTYVFTYTVSSAGCPDATADVTITVNQAPDAGLAATVEACEDEGAFDLFTSLGGTPQATNGVWTEDAGNPATSILTQSGDGSTGTADLTTAIGTYNFTYTVTAPGCSPSTAILTVNVSALPDAGTAGSADACNNDAAFNLYNVLGGTPQLSGSFAAAIGNPEAVTISQPGDGSTSTADFDGVATGTYVFTYTVSSAGCPDATADVTITVNQAPDAGLAATVEACEDEGAFDLFTSLGGTPQATNGVWTEDAGNPATSILTQSGDGSTGTADLTTAIGTYNFTYTVTAPGCSPSTAILTVNVSALPDAGTAGSADACNNDAAFNLYNVLGGTPQLSGSFAAAIGNPEAVTISQPGDGSTSTADFDGVATGTYVFTYTVSSAGCPDATADVTITVNQAPDAGLAATVEACEDEGAFDLFTSLGGTPQATNGVWTEDAGNPATSILTQSGDGSTGTADLTTAIGTYNFTYTVTAPGCSPSTAILTVNVSALPDAGTAGSADACNNDAAFNLYNVLGGTPQLSGSFAAAIGNPEAVTISQPGDGSTSTADFDGVATGTYVFTYTVSSAGCPDATADVTITVNQAPDAGLAATVEACEDEGAFDLFTSLGGTPQATNGVWTEDAGNPATSILTQSGDGSTGTADLTTAIGTYNFTYTVTAPGCSPSTAILTVNVSALPDAGTAGSADACNNDAAFNLYNVLGGTPQLSGSFAAAIGNPEAVTISQPGDGSTSTADFDGVATGTYVFTYTVSSAGCPDATADVTITVNQAPDAGLAATVEACEDEGAFDLFTSLGGTPQATNGVWTEDAGNPATSILTQSGDGSTGTADLTTAIGTYNFTYTVTAPGCSPSTAILTVNVSALPDAGTAGSADACNNDAAFNLYNVLGGTPQLSGSFAAAIGNPEAVTISQPGDGSTSTADFDGVATGTYVFTYTVSSAGCPDATADVTITVNQAPDAGLAATVEACEDEGAFDLFTSLGGTPQATNGVWTEDAGNPATSILTQSGDGSTGTADLTTAIGTYNFTYTVTAPGCSPSTAILTVNVSALPDAGTAGSADACNNDAAFNLYNVLGGTPQLSGSFAAAIGNPEAVTISQPGDGSTSTADFDGVATGTYVFTYTVSSAGCPDATADVTITVNQAPDAGLAATVEACEDEGAFDLFTSLGGTPQATNGVWTEDAGNPATSILTQSGDGSTGTADLTTAIGTYNFTYTVTAPGCSPSTAILTVNVSALPDAGTAGSADACNNDAAFNLYNVLGGTPQLSGSFAAAIGNPEAVTISQPGDGSTSTADFDGVATGTYVFTYTVSSAGCPDATADVTITVNQAPDAGLAATVEACEDEGAFDLFTSLGGTPQATNGVWTEDAGNPATSILTQSGDGSTGTADLTTAIGTYNFTYTVTAPGCSPSTAILTVNVSALPDAGTAGSADACNNDAAFNLYNVLGGTPQLSGSFAAAIGNPEAVTISQPGDGSTSTADFDGVATGTYVFTYTVSSAGCPDATADVTITVNQAPDAGLAATVEACEDEGAFDLFTSLGGTPQATNGVWTEDAGNPATSILTQSGDGSTGTADLTTAIGTYNFTYTVTAPGCSPSTAILTVNVSALPDAGTAGSADACNNDAAFNLYNVLGGTPQLSGSFAAAIGNPEAVTISQPGDGSTSTADFDGVATGTYVFTYTVSSAGCPDATADVTITVNQAPDAGLAATVEACEDEGAFDLFTSLGGTPQATNGVWTEDAGNPATSILTQSGDGSTGTADLTTAIGTYNFTYTVTAPGCSPSTAILTVNVSALPDAGTAGSADACNNDAAFNLYNVLGGTPQLSGSFAAAIGNPEAVTISQPGDGSTSTADFDGVATGTYVFTYTVSSAGCPDATADVTINVNSLTVTLNTNNPTSGCGLADGSLDIIANSSFAGDTFTFDWSSPNGYNNIITGSDGDISGLESGDYTVVVTSNNTGCEFTDTYTVADPVPFTINVLSVNVQSECDVDNGGIDIEVTGGTGPYNYYIEDVNAGTEVSGSRLDNDASNTYSYNLLAPGDYEVFVEEGSCTQSELFTVDPVDKITATIANFVEPSCGATDGNIELDVTDVGNDFDVTIDDGVNPPNTITVTATTPTTVNLTNLGQGSYTITVTDNTTNCDVVLNQVLNDNAAFDIDNGATTVTSIQTCDGNQGAIDVVITGTLSGTESYSWTGPTGFTDPSTKDLTLLELAGDYQLTVEDAGCTVVSDVFTITEPTPPTSVAGQDSTICENAITLYADALAADQVGEWILVSQPTTASANIVSPNDPASDFENLIEIGDYTLAWLLENTVTSCSDTDTIVITRKTITVADAGAAQQVCGTTATLAANAAGTNETGIWTVVSGSGNFASGEENNPAAEVTGLSAGDNIFEWTITDDNAICDPTSNQVTITADPLPTAYAGEDEAFCDITTIDLSTLDGGNTPPLAENGTIEWTTSSTDGGSFDDNTIETPVYTFGTDDIADGTVTLTMTVTGTGACSAEVVSDEVVLNIANSPVIDPLADAAICYVDVNSTFDVDATVSNEASILWSSTGTGSFDDETSASTFYIPSAADSTAGTVDLTITAEGAGACGNVSETLTLTINSLRAIGNVSPTSACGVDDGSISLTIESNTSGPFGFVWSGPDSFASTDQNISGLAPGNYTVQVTDESAGSDCIVSETFKVEDPAAYSISNLTETPQTECDVENGGVSIEVIDGTGPFNYYITDNESPQNEIADSRSDNDASLTYSFNELAPGTYNIYVEEGACQLSQEFTINPADAITASVNTVSPADCNGGTNGAIDIDIVPVGNPYTIEVSDVNGVISTDNFTATDVTFTASGLSQGTYTITITDDVTNCEVVINQIVNENAAFTIDNSVITDIATCGGSEGEISLDISGLSGSESISWAGPNNFTASTQNISGLSNPGDYTITIEDNGCTVEQIYSITQPAECDYDCEDFKVSPITEAATCLGVDDGKLFFLLRNVNGSSPELNFDIKQAGADDALYKRFTVDNIGQGLIIEIDSSFATGTYTVVASDPNLECVSDTFNINIGTKTNLTATIDIEQPTCTISTGSISANIAGTNDEFEFILYFEGDSLTANTTGVFADLEEGDYELEFDNQNTNACGVDNQTFTIENTAVVDQSAVDINITNPECGEIFGTISASLNNLPSNYEFILVDENGDEFARNETGIFNEVPEGTYIIQFENMVDPGACPIADRGGIVIENNGSFTAVASDVENIVCHGDSDGSAVITLEGVSTGYYSVDNGVIWNEFTSGNRITGLPEVNNILVSDQPGTSDCELSVAVGIEYLSDPIELDGGSPIIITEASCDESETDGVIEIPEITGGVEPYSFEIDGNAVELNENRQITGLNKLTEVFTIIDDSGCSKDFQINTDIAPNQISARVEEINDEGNKCIEEPEGIKVRLTAFTVNNIPGPFTLILNRSDVEETVEIPLNLDNNNGNPEFFIGPNYDLNYTFEKGQQYNWTIRTTNSQQSCSTDGIVNILDGAIIPTFEMEGIDAACNDGSGALRLFNIQGDMEIPVEYQIFEGNASTPTVRINENNLPVTGEYIIDPNNYGVAMGFVSGGYNVRIVQRPSSCNNDIVSEIENAQIQQPSGNLVVELVPEPNLPPGVEREFQDMNPKPTSRRDKSDGSISVRISNESGAEAYYALLSLADDGRVSGAAPYIFNTDTVELIPNESYTFENLSAGTYIIEYFDSFGRCTQQLRIVQDKDGATDGIYVGFDESPFIPNVFTPNNDQKNDYFKILNLPDNGANLIVTNRNGTIVYENENYGPTDRESNLWDGGDSPDGIYFYRLEVNGSAIQTGWVEILRGRR